MTLHREAPGFVAPLHLQDTRHTQAAPGADVRHASMRSARSGRTAELLQVRKDALNAGRKRLCGERRVALQYSPVAEQHSAEAAERDVVQRRACYERREQPQRDRKLAHCKRQCRA